MHQFTIRFLGIWKPTFGCGRKTFRCFRKKNNSETQLKQTGLFKIILFYLFTCFLPSSLYFIHYNYFHIFNFSIFRYARAYRAYRWLRSILGDFIRGDHFPVCTTYASWLGTTPLTKRFSLVKTEGRKGDPDNYPDVSGHPLTETGSCFCLQSEGFVTSLLTGSQTEHGLWTLQIVVSSRCCFIVCSKSCYQHFGV